MKKPYLFLMVLVAAVLMVASTASTASTVEGGSSHLGGGGHDFGPFDPRMIPVESQAWWKPNYGHIHGLVQVPLGQTVTGDFIFDMRVVLHNNPGTITFLRVNHDGGIFWREDVNWECPYDGTISNTCAWNKQITLDTTQMKDGWREFRIIVNVVTPDGKRFFRTTGIPINVQNGGADKDYNRGNNQGFIGRGWYTGAGDSFEKSYANAWIETVPLAPVSGTHTFNVRAQKASDHLTVALDKTHAIPAVGPWPEVQMDMGQILFDQDGDYQAFFPIAVDTTKLANGWHSLAVNSRGPNGSTSQCSYCNGEVNHLHGISKIWFYVENGSPPPPVAIFTGIPTSGYAPLPVAFTDASTGGIDTWSWDFGDTDTSTLQNPDHTYSDAGTYTVSLTVTGPSSADTSTMTNYIIVTAPPPPPVAGFTGTPTSGDAPLLVAYSDASTGSIDTWNWDFGDTDASTLRNPDHTYNAAGTYTVSLTVTGPGGNNTQTRTDYITVTAPPPPPPPVAGFTGTPTSGDAPLLVAYSDASTGSIDTWSWDFGDADTSTLQNPDHTYNAAGTYTVSLTVTGPGGNNTQTRTDYITVTAPATPQPNVSSIVMKVQKKGPNLQALAEVYSEKGALIEATFYFDEQQANTTSGTVGGKGFAKLSSDKVQGAVGSELFEVQITNATGVTTCQVLAIKGETAICLP